MSLGEKIWLAIGFAGQILFTGRFMVQWLASERQKSSVMPVSFWWLSIAGSALLLAYAFYRQDPVIITGQLTGIFIYGRNLSLIERERRRAEAAKATVAMPAATPEAQPLRKAG